MGFKVPYNPNYPGIPGSSQIHTLPQLTEQIPPPGIRAGWKTRLSCSSAVSWAPLPLPSATGRIQDASLQHQPLRNTSHTRLAPEEWECFALRCPGVLALPWVGNCLCCHPSFGDCPCCLWTHWRCWCPSEGIGEAKSSPKPQDIRAAWLKPQAGL